MGRAWHTEKFSVSSTLTLMKKRRRNRRAKAGRHQYHSAIRLLAEDRVRVLENERRRMEFLMQAVVIPGESTEEGTLVAAVTVPWLELAKQISRDPNFMFQIDWRKWEEILAGAYKAQGFDEVVLTPRAGDLGRDVIAVRHGVLSIRILGQMKSYKPGHLVPADDVRALLGVINGDHGASKGVLTTTSDFAPRIHTDAIIAPHLPTRLELISGTKLREWLRSLAQSES